MKHQNGVISAAIVFSLLWGYQVGAIADEPWALGKTPHEQPRRTAKESWLPTTFHLPTEAKTPAASMKSRVKKVDSNQTIVDSTTEMHDPDSKSSATVSAYMVKQPKRSRIANVQKENQELHTVEILIPTPSPDVMPTEQQKINERLFDRWTNSNKIAWKKKFSDSEKREVVTSTVMPTVFTIRRFSAIPTNRRAK